jgi:hypothetical protein
MGILKDWFKNKVASLGISLSNVEKNLLSQDKKSLEDDTKQVQRHLQGTLLDSLLHGELTQEVKNLRWRTYKIYKEMSKYKPTFSYLNDDDDNPPEMINIETVDKKKYIKNIKVDDYDNYDLELSFNNIRSTLNLTDAIETEITLKDYDAKIKGDVSLKINRNFIPKFYIENFTKKLNIRTIDDKNKLLEFYVSKYSDMYNPQTNVFINQIKKIINNGPSNHNFLEFDEVGFMTNNTIGADDFLLYTYDNIFFDKIVEFDGYYVIKFKAKVLINGEDLLKDFVQEELEKKYDNKETKKVK